MNTTTLQHDNQISAFARLLATENIIVRHSAHAQTASFDVVSRILTLPRWKNMTDEVYDMLVGHEVAHALWTDGTVHEETGALQAAVDIDPEAPRNAMGVINVVEDARIERLIKAKYPGLKRDFAAGYKYLHDIDLFAIAEQGGVSAMGFLDRLNLHFKLGILGILQVPMFNDTEVWFRDRIAAAETWDDVIEISRDLYEYETQEQEQEQEQVDAPQGSGDAGGTSNGQSSGEANDPEDSDDRGDAQSSERGQGAGDSDEAESDAGSSAPDSSGGTSSNSGTEETKKAPEIRTQDAMDEGLRDDYQYRGEDQVSTMPMPILDNILVDAETIRRDHLTCRHRYGWSSQGTPLTAAQVQEREQTLTSHFFECDQFMNSEKSTVNLLAKQFEMRKAADEHKRTMISKSGRLDPVKMINYRWSEDIFAKNTTVRDGKNHGFVIVVDWSGSMANNLVATVKQAITLAMFCRKVGIPFDLYAFSDRTGQIRQYDDNDNVVPNPISSWENNEDNLSCLRLLHFLNSKMSQREFRTACRILFSIAVNEGPYVNGYNNDAMPHTHNHVTHCLGGTPLDETLVALHWILPQFRQRHNLQVVNAVLLSDGCGCQRFNGVIHNPINRVTYGTRRNEIGSDRRVDSTCLLLESLKQTTGANLIGMYLSTGKNPIRTAYGQWINRYELEDAELRRLGSEYKKNRFIVAPGLYGKYFDEAYIVDANSNPETNINLPDSAQTHAKLRSAFVKGMKSRGMSRNLVNRFIEAVAR